MFSLLFIVAINLKLNFSYIFRARVVVKLNGLKQNKAKKKPLSHYFGFLLDAIE